jgi:hypothetical protein
MGGVRGEKRKLFFFEKKNQKTFATGGRSLVQAPGSDSGRTGKKFFGSFFQKRTPSFLTPQIESGVPKVTPGPL